MPITIRGKTSLSGRTYLRPLSNYSVDRYDPKTVADFSGVYNNDIEYYRSQGKTTSFSDMFTHVRDSNATMVDSDGLLKWAPHNLLTYSNVFTSGWSVGGSTTVTADFAESPDKTTNATRLVMPSGAGAFINRAATVVNGISYTFEIAVKRNGGSDQNFSITLIDGGGSSASGDLVATDTWQVFSVTRTMGGTSLTILVDNNAAGDATDLLIYGSRLYRSDLGGMVNNPDTASSYVPTTSSAVYLPRRNHYGWNGSTWVNKGLLLETEARTNLLTYSNDFSNAAWIKALGVSVTPAPDVPPDGTTTAYTVTSSVNQISQSVSCSASTTYTDSLYIKKTTGATYTPGLYLIFTGGTLTIYAVILDTNTGVATAVSAGGFTAPTAFSVSDEEDYWRLSVTGNSVDNTTVSLRLYANLNSSSGAGAGSQIIWGAQLEAGSTPSSYIPTTGASDTRALETLTIPAAKMAWPTPNVIGPELVTNGTFDTDSDWTKGANWTIGGGVASNSGGTTTSPLTQIGVQQGKIYEVRVNVVSLSGGLLAWTGSGVTFVRYLSLGDNIFYWVPQTTSGTFGVITGNSTTVATVDNISVKEIDPLSVSLQMQGQQTYVDDNAALNNTFLAWPDTTSSNYIWLFGDSDRGTGGITFRQRAIGVVSGLDGSGSSYSPGVNVPFNIASRHGSTFINGAVDGTALTEDTTPTALPDLSATDLQLAPDYMGTIALFREDNNDWGDSGIQKAST